MDDDFYADRHMVIYTHDGVGCPKLSIESWTVDPLTGEETMTSEPWNEPFEAWAPNDTSIVFGVTCGVCLQAMIPLDTGTDANGDADAEQSE